MGNLERLENLVKCLALAQSGMDLMCANAHGIVKRSLRLLPDEVSA
jgi:hypothetical protein